MGSDTEDDGTTYSSNQSDQEQHQDKDDGYSDVGGGIGVLTRGANNGAFDSLFSDEVEQEDLSAPLDFAASPLRFETKLFTDSKPDPTKKKKRAPPSKANLASEQEQEGKKTKSKSSSNNRQRKTKAPERDDLRPESEQELFNPLQLAKEKQRRAQQLKQLQQQATSTMGKSKPNTKNTAMGASAATGGSAQIPRKQRTTVQQPDSVAPAVSQGSTTGSPGTSVTSSTNSDSASASAREKRPRPHNEDGLDYSTLTDEQIDYYCELQQEKDKKTKTADRLKLIDRLRRRAYELRRAFGKDAKTSEKEWNELKAQNTQLKAALAKSKGQVVNLTAENESLHAAATLRLSRAKSQILRMCNDTRDKVLSAAKNELFHTVKFINCKDDLYSGTEKVHDWLQLGEKTLDMRDSWVETYAPVVKKGINSGRNYVTSELKKVAFALLNKKETLPPHELLLACAARKISGINEVKFKWYWETVLAKVAGSKEWGPTVCYYKTILEARMSTNPKKPLVTVSDEAFIVVVWENNFEKWQQQWAFEQDPGNKGLKQPNLPGKYTQSDKGQCEWGGWSEAGLKAFNQYKKTIREYRKEKMDEIHAFEHRILAELRAERGVEAEDHDQQLRVNRAKRRKLNSKKPVADSFVLRKVVRTTDSDDELD